MLPRIAIIGAGSMGGAIARALAGKCDQVIVTNRTQAKADLLDVAGITSIAAESNPHANEDALKGASIVLLGVKPDQIAEVAAELAPSLDDGAIVVSVAAGVTCAAIETAVPGHPVVRAMPNTPSGVGKGVTGIAPGALATPEQMAQIHEVFATCGAVVEVEESQIDALSTISGSGPAYVFLLIEKFTEAAIAKGFTPEQAALMAEQTFIGAAALLEASGKTPTELRIAVTSPKGTTERALNVLEDADLATLFTDATDAALARAKELASLS